MAVSLHSEHVAQPCRAKLLLYGMISTDPSDGRERLWLTNQNENYGGELIAVDFENDTGEVYRWPAGHGSWCIHSLKDDRLAISTYFDGKFLVFDKKSREFTDVIDFPDEQYIWDMATGADGRVYGGTYSGAKLGCFSPEDGSFEDCGSPDEGTGNLYLRNVVASPAGDIVCTFGYERSHTMLYRVAEKTFEPLLSDEPDAAIAPIVSIGDILYATHPDRGLIALQGENLAELERLPLPGCPIDDAWGGIARYSTEERIYLTKDAEIWCWKPDEDALQKVFDIPLRGGRVIDVTADGRLVGVRGQDYFVASPGDDDITLRAVPTEASGRASHFLVGEAPGAGRRIWGGPTFGQTVYYLDVDTCEYVNTGSVVDGGGEVYGAVPLNGKLYTASYAGADFAVYDPAQPWDQWHGVNPRHIASLRDREMCRPTGRMSLGPDGNLYSGWQATYGKFGGALARLNPETDEITVWNDPLGDEPIATFAVDTRYAYLGTFLGANGLPSREGFAQFGVFDLEEEKTVFQQRMDGMSSVSCIGALPEIGKALILHGDEIFVFDVESLSFVDTLTEPMKDSPGWKQDVVRLPDGDLLFCRSGEFVRIGADLNPQVIGAVEHQVEHFTYGPDNMIYYSSGADLYRFSI